MADGTTPSAAAVVDVTSDKKKPEKPDEELYQANLKKAEKEHSEAKAKFYSTSSFENLLIQMQDAARAKIDVAQPNKSKDSPTAKKRQELISQLTEIRQKQAGGKAGRSQVFDQIKKLDEQLKSRIAEQKTARSRVSFKNVEEIDREIERLEKQVNGGMMKLVDEKKALAEVSSLRKQRKGFSGLDEAQKGIDETKAKIKALKDSLEDPEAKALSAKYDELQAELNGIKAEQDEAYKNISALRDQREKLHAEQQEKYLAVKKVKDDYYHQKKAFQSYEFEARQRARERQKAEREAYDNAKKRERAEKMLAEARDPAYMDEIRRAESLLHYLDPTTNTAAAPLLAPSGLSAAPQRTVDALDIKGTRVVRKDEREDTYFMGTGGKKGKKGRKGAGESPVATPPASGKFSLPPSVMEDCSAMGIDPPMSAADIPAVSDKVKEKLAHWRADQKAQTDRNIAKATKEIERLDAEGTDSSPATPTTNGHLKKDTTPGDTATKIRETVSSEAEKVKNAASDIVADLKDASIEDKE